MARVMVRKRTRGFFRTTPRLGLRFGVVRNCMPHTIRRCCAMPLAMQWGYVACRHQTLTIVLAHYPALSLTPFRRDKTFKQYHLSGHRASGLRRSEFYHNCQCMMITSRPKSNLSHTNPPQQRTLTITIPTHHRPPPPSTDTLRRWSYAC